MDSVPGQGRSPRGGNGNPLHCSCLGNPMDREAQQGTQPIGSQRVGHTTEGLPTPPPRSIVRPLFFSLPYKMLIITPTPALGQGHKTLQQVLFAASLWTISPSRSAGSEICSLIPTKELPGLVCRPHAQTLFSSLKRDSPSVSQREHRLQNHTNEVKPNLCYLQVLGPPANFPLIYPKHPHC